LFIDALIITLLFFIFAIPHSILASQEFKIFVVNKLGNKIAFYRLFYNFVSIVSFILIYLFSPKPDFIIYDLLFPYDIIVVILQLLSFVALLWASKFINMKEFLGISQITRYYHKNYNYNDLDEILELRIEGPFKFSRHPIYLFASFFLILRPTMDFFYLVFVINMLVYFYIGSYYEERKLIKIFGKQYEDYQKSVPKIFPFFNLSNK
jgi:protein-S-isoprenylcysteine O-methyltransferase Ste14